MAVLGLILFLSLIIPAVLGLALVGLRVTSDVVRVDREEQYNATSALDAAIRQAQVADWIARPEAHGGVCPEQAVRLHDESDELTVSCEPRSEFCEDRTVTFRVHDAEGEHRASANVSFRHREGGPVVDVLTWSSDPASQVTPPPYVACPPPEVHEDIAAVTAWGVPTVSLADGGTEWSAEVVLTVVTDVLGDPVAGAAVTVEVAYRQGGVWHLAGQLNGVTGADGEWRAESAPYPVGPPSTPVERVRFSVVGLVAGSLLWDHVPERDVVEASAPSVLTVASIAPRSPMDRNTSGNNYHVWFVVEVRDNAGEPVAGALVEVERRIWSQSQGWRVDTDPLPGPPDNPATFVTGEDGRVTIRSRNYQQTGNHGGRVRDIELTVTNVSSPGRTWSGATWPGGQLTASIPYA